MKAAAYEGIRGGTSHHVVLRMLEFGDSHEDMLYIAQAGAEGREKMSQWRNRVLYVLRDRHLVERVGPGQWRMTDKGRDQLRLLGTVSRPTEAANDDAMRPPRSTLSALEQPVRVAREDDRHLLTRSPVRTGGTAERLPVPVRSGSMDFAVFPSRRGNRLYYRDGRVTDMDGNPIEVSA